MRLNIRHSQRERTCIFEKKRKKGKGIEPRKKVTFEKNKKITRKFLENKKKKEEKNINPNFDTYARTIFHVSSIDVCMQRSRLGSSIFNVANRHAKEKEQKFLCRALSQIEENSRGDVRNDNGQI